MGCGPSRRRVSAPKVMVLNIPTPGPYILSATTFSWRGDRKKMTETEHMTRRGSVLTVDEEAVEEMLQQSPYQAAWTARVLQMSGANFGLDAEGSVLTKPNAPLPTNVDLPNKFPVEISEFMYVRLCKHATLLVSEPGAYLVGRGIAVKGEGSVIVPRLFQARGQVWRIEYKDATKEDGERVVVITSREIADESVPFEMVRVSTTHATFA